LSLEIKTEADCEKPQARCGTRKDFEAHEIESRREAYEFCCAAVSCSEKQQQSKSSEGRGVVKSAKNRRPGATQQKKMQQYHIILALFVAIGLLVTPIAIRADDDDDHDDHDDDHDDDKCHRLELPRLFGTKTLYKDAREAIRRLDDHLPKPFDDDSLEHEHKDLIKDGCSPVVLYFMGRHSARFPDGEDIEKYNKDLLELIKRMNSTPASAPRGACRKMRQDFLRWTPVMQFKHDNLITEVGGAEEREIARRFKRLYPDFFDGQKADIKIGVTKKIRTAQTGSEFLKEVQGLNLPPSCQNTPTNDPFQSGYNLDKVLEAACYKYLINEHEAPFLDFHKKCEEISGEEKIKDPLIDRVKDPKLKRRMANKIARKLGLRFGPSGEPPLSVDTLDSIWNMCKFEVAMRNDSIWCSLFDKRQIEILEYIEDVNTYIKSAYGPKANVRQSCPVVSNLVESFQDAIRERQADGAAGAGERSGGPRKRAYFYFSHADPIKKLIAAFGMFKDDDSFTPVKITDFESRFRVPRRRRWRSSLISPFSANLAFVLYQCPKSSRSSDKQDKFKVLASVTEQPVKLGGCKDTDCNIVRFMEAYEGMRNCDLNKICLRS
jgi:hypothetical protein